MIMSVKAGLTWTAVVLAATVTMATAGRGFAVDDDIVGNEGLEDCLRDHLPSYEIEWIFKEVLSPHLVAWNVTADGQLSDTSTCNSSLSCYPLESFVNDSIDCAMPAQLRPTQMQRGQRIRFPSLLVSGNGTVRLQLVDRNGFLECDATRGRLLSLTSDGSSRRPKTVDAVSSSHLKMGVNYLIAVDMTRPNHSSSLFFCESGLRINLTVKDNNDCIRLSNETCFNRGRCVANFTSSSFYCRCCPGYECLRRNHDDFAINRTIGARNYYKIRSNNRMINSNSYETKAKPDSVVTDRVLHYSRCNSTSTCRTPNNTACVVRDKGIKDPHCSCTKTKSAADCAKDEKKAKAHEETEEEAADEEEEEEEMDICDPNPCLNGICIVDGKHEDSFRCYCIPGFGGRLCDLVYNSPCSPNPCRNNGVCRPTNEDLDRGGLGRGIGREGGGGGGGEEGVTGTQIGERDEGEGDKLQSFECLCRPGYVKDDCSFKVTVCQSNPCQHVCFDHGDYYVCECNPGFTGENCDVLINTCESNPCHNGGTCDSNPYGYSCRCPFGYHGSHCEQHAFPDFLVPPQHPPQLHSLQMVGFTLTGAVAIAMAVIVCCYCNLGRFCDVLFCPSATTPLTKYEKQLDHYRRRSSISNVDRKRRRNQSLDGDCAATNAFMDDDVETTSLQDRLFVEEDDIEDPISEDGKDRDRGTFRDASGPHRAGRSMSRLHLLDV